MQLSTRIATLLARHPGTRAADLARVAGVSTASVADWMNGTTKSMKPEPARRLSAQYGCDQNWLMSGVGSADWATGSGGDEDSTAAAVGRPTVDVALRAIRAHLERGTLDQNEAAGDALKLLAKVPDSDRAFEQALAALTAIR